MGMKIGELFMDLGFNVDDKSLKSFNAGVSETLNSMLKLAGVTASAAGFVSIMTGASDTALALRNMTKEFGYSAEGMQRWAAIAHQANPAITHEQGLASYLKMAEYMRDMRMGKNDGMAFGMFGGTIADDTPEKMQARIKAALPGVISHYGRGMASQWIDQIHGAIGAISAYDMSDSEWNAAGDRGKRNAQDDKDLVDMRLAVSALKEEWDVFMDHIAASFAPTLTKLMKSYEKGGFWGFVDSLGESDPLDMSNWSNKMRSGAHDVAGFLQDHNFLSGGQDESMQFWLSKGYTPAQAAAFVAQEKHESGFNPHAVGDGGLARGSFQWHPDRQKAILDATGIDVTSADHYKQLQAADWEFKNRYKNLAKTFDSLKNDPYNASAFLSRHYEVAAGKNGAEAEAAERGRTAEGLARTVTINSPITIHSTAPAQDVAYHAVSELNKQLVDANAQTDLGASH